MKLSLKPLAYGVMLALSAKAQAAGIPDYVNATGTGVFFDAHDGANPSLDVSVTNPNTVINWNGSGFNVGANGTVNFNSTVGPTSILNYDNSGAMSNIQGAVNNGGNKLFLVNPNGISDSSGAFSGLMATDADKVSLDSAGKLNITIKGDPIVGYGTVTGTASKDSDLDIVFTRGTGSIAGNMILGGDHANITVVNDRSMPNIDAKQIKLTANSSTISSTGGGSLELKGLVSNDVEINGFDSLTLYGNSEVKNLTINGNGESSTVFWGSSVNHEAGVYENAKVRGSSVSLVDGVSVIGLDMVGENNRLSVTSSNLTGANVKLTGENTDNIITIRNGYDGKSEVSGDFAATKIQISDDVKVTGATFSEYKDLTIKDGNVNFDNVTLNASGPAAITNIVNVTGDFNSLTQNGGVINIDANSGGVLTFNNLVHHAYVGGAVIDISNGSTVNLNSSDITYNSDDDINQGDKYSTTELVEAGATNSFVATAKGTGGNLNISGGNIYAEKSIKFVHEDGAGGNLSLNRVDILSKEADIELIKNDSFTTTKEDGENSVELASDGSSDPGNKGVIIIDDEEVRDGVSIVQGEAYTSDRQSSGSNPWGEKSSDNRIAVDWANTTLDRADIKEGKASFESKAISIQNPDSDGGEGGTDDDGSGSGSGSGDNGGGSGGDTTITPPVDTGSGTGTGTGGDGTGATDPSDNGDEDGGTGAGTGSGTTNPDDGSGAGAGAGTGTGTGTGGSGTETGSGSGDGSDSGAEDGSNGEPGSGSDSGSDSDAGTGSDAGSGTTDPDQGSGNGTGSGTDTDTGTGGDSGEGGGSETGTDPDDGSGSGTGSGSETGSSDGGSSSGGSGGGSGGSGSDDGIGSGSESGGSDNGSGAGPETGTGAGNENGGTDEGSGSGTENGNGESGAGAGTGTESGSSDPSEGQGGTGGGTETDTGSTTTPGGTDADNQSPSIGGNGESSDGQSGGSVTQPGSGSEGGSGSETGSNGSGSDGGSGTSGGIGDSEHSDGGITDPTDVPTYPEIVIPTDPSESLPTNPGSSTDTGASEAPGSSQPGIGSGDVGSNSGDLPENPGSGNTIDPDTGWQIDEETGWPVDPSTGIPTEPGSPSTPGTQGGQGSNDNSSSTGPSSSGSVAEEPKAWTLTGWVSSIFGSNDEEKKRKKLTAQQKAREARAKIDLQNVSEIRIIN